MESVWGSKISSHYLQLVIRCLQKLAPGIEQEAGENGMLITVGKVMMSHRWELSFLETGLPGTHTTNERNEIKTNTTVAPFCLGLETA